MFPENDIPIHKDKIYESLFGDYEANFDSMTQAALEMSMHGLLLILERQAKDQLPGGKFWDPSQDVKKTGQ